MPLLLENTVKENQIFVVHMTFKRSKLIWINNFANMKLQSQPTEMVNQDIHFCLVGQTAELRNQSRYKSSYYISSGKSSDLSWVATDMKFFLHTMENVHNNICIIHDNSNTFSDYFLACKSFFSGDQLSIYQIKSFLSKTFIQHIKNIDIWLCGTQQLWADRNHFLVKKKPYFSI